MNICLVCLRTDLELKVIDSRLGDFHEELCDYSYYSIDLSDPKFCTVCEHLLRKLYHFKEKCVLAINILKNWNNKKDENRPLNQLFTLLPQSALGNWIPSNNNILYFEEEPKPVSYNSTPSSEPVLNRPMLTLVPNLDILKPRTTLKVYVPIPLATSVNVPRPTWKSVKVPRPTGTSVNVLRPTGTSVNVPRPIGTSVNVPRPSVPSANKTKPSMTSVPVLKCVPISHLENIFPMEKLHSTDKKQHLDNNSNQGSINKKKTIKVIQLKKNSDDDLNLEHVLRTEEITTSYSVIVPEHKINGKTVAVSENNDIQPQIQNDTEIVEYLDDTILNSDDDTATDNVQDFTFNHIEDIDTDSSINSKDFLLIDKALEDSNIDSDDNNDKIKVNDRCSTVNKGSPVVPNICLSDDEAEIKDEDVNVTSDDGNDTANKLIADMENINEELDSINDNYEKLILQSGNNIWKTNKLNLMENKYTKRCSKHSMFSSIDEDMDAIQEICENVVKAEDKQPSPLLQKPYSLSALKENLKAKFDASRDIISCRGVALDKEHILNCLDGRASKNLIEILWNAVNSETYLTKNAVRLLALIQNFVDNSKYESVFDIEYMNTPEAMKEELQKRQTYPGYIKAQYKCELCYTVFRYEKHLEKHNKMHDERSGSLVCSICGVRRKSRRNYAVHLHSHDAVYKCKLCPLVTYSRASMVNHYNQHKGVKYICKPCNKIFRSFSAYKTHCAYAHRRAHVCTTCGRTFETEEKLNKHKKFHRAMPSTDGNTSVKCDACDLTFPSQEVFVRHNRFTHGAPLYQKPTKGQQTKPIVKRKDRKSTCPVCKAVGSSYGWLVRHGRLEHDEDMNKNPAIVKQRHHLCDVCGQGFTNKYRLRDHINKHAGVLPHACDLCPKSFHNSSSLIYHRSYHFPPKEMCTQCGKLFYTTSNLYVHMQAHIGDRRFKCDICGKGFLYNATLKEHKSGVHNNVRRVRKRGGTEAGVGASEQGSGGTEARGARTSTVARTKRRKMREVESTDESSDSSD